MNGSYIVSKILGSFRNFLLFLVMIILFLGAGIGLAWGLASRVGDKPTVLPSQPTLPVAGDETEVGDGLAQKLTVNAQLEVNGQFYLAPSVLPSSARAGTIVFDKSSNTLQYHDGTKFVSIQATVKQQSASGGVSSLQGQTGAVTLVSGNGIAISGTTISNSGILDIISAPNGIGVSTSGGVATLSLPQGLSVTDSPTFGGITVSGGAISVNNINQTGGGQPITINAGNDQVTITANGRSYVLPSSGPASQTICTTGISCVAGGGQSVMLAPGSAQSDNTSDVSVFINDTGGGNLLQLQTSGTDSFVVASNGDTTVGGILHSNTITPTAAFTIGSTSQSFTLQGTSASTLKAQNGGNTTTVSFVTPTANTTLSFPALAAGSYQVCTTSGNCLGSGGGANASLSNLSSVAINTSLLPGSTTIDLGSGANAFRDLYLGGTATNNFKLTGVASAARTITVPDASGTLAVSASGNIALSAAGNITFTGQLAVVSGGTGSGTQAGARLNLGAAASGANNDITSLTGLTTALGVGYGGTGSTTFTQYGLLVGNGAGAVGTTVVPGSGGLCLISNVSASPSFQVCPGGAGTSVSVSSPGTTNQLAKFTGTTTIADSSISDDGSTVSVSIPLSAASVTTSLLQSTGALTITPGSTFTAGATNQQFVMQGTSLSQIKGQSGSFATTLSFTTPTANRSILLPDEAGTICIQGSTNCGFASAGSGVTSLNSQTGSVSINNASGSGGVVTLNNAAADGSTKGIAAFNATNFSASSGVINTIQGISTSASPQFANITLGTSGVVTANNFTHTAAGQSLSISTGADAITFHAGGIDFIFPTTGPGSQTICTTGISCVAGGGQGVLLAPGTAQSDNSTDASLFINKTNTGYILDLQNSGTNVLTLSNTGTLSVNTIAPLSGGFTLGSTGNTFTLQGDGSSTISATTGAGTTLIGFTGSAPAGTVRYNFDRNPTGGAGTYTVCTTDGNCSGLSGAVSSPGGTTGRIPKFTAAQTVGDSILSESGSVITVNSGSLVIQGSSGLTLGTATTANGKIDFKNSTNSNTLTLQSGASSSSYSLTLPVADGIANQCVKTNGSGQLTFGDCLTGSGGGGGVTQLNGNSGSVTIQGTSNQVSVTGNGVNPIVLSLPQNIATSSTPTFQSLTLSGSVSAGLKVGSTGTAGRVVIGDGGGTEHTATFITATLAADKVITIPNFTGATATLPVTASGFIAIDAAGNISTTGTLAVASGGTAASTAAGARSNLGAAASGANGDITATTALNTITPSTTLTVGATGQALVLQGNASTSLSATSSGITNSIVFATPTSSNKTITFPDLSGTVCLTSGNCLGGGAGGANTALSNLASVAINTSLLPGTTTIDLGSASAPFRDLYIGGAATNNFKFSGSATGARTFALPDASGTLAVSASGNISLSAAGNITLTGQVPVANGGTGASTAQAAINTLTGLTTTGDLLYYNGTNVVRLARGSDTQCLLSNSTTIQWGTCTGDGVGVTLIGTIDTQTASSNGGVIVGSTLYMQSASATNPGLVNTGTQTLAGSKTFSNQITANGGVSLAVGQALTVNGDTFTDLTGTGLQVTGNALQTTLGTSVDLTSEVNGTLPIANGGTGNTTSQTAINALSQLTTNGDLLYHNGTNSTRLARGTTGQCLLSDASTILWSTCTGDGIGVTTVGAIDSQTKSANGAVIAGTSIYLQNADASNVGLVSAGAQTFGGLKTFGSGLTVTAGQTFTFNSDAFTDLTGTGLTISSGALQTTLGTSVDLTSEVNGILPVANGGIGVGTLTSNGVLYGNGTGVVQATSAGTTGQCLLGNTGSAPTFGTCTGAGGVATIGAIDTQTKSANGAVIASTTLYLQTADASNVGLVSTGTQTFAGNKTFSGTITVANITPSANLTIGTSDTTGTLLVLDTKTGSGDPTGVNGGMYYNSNAGKFRCYQNSGWTDCITASGGDILQNGNSFTAAMTIGTNDAFDLNLETGGTTRFTINSAASLLTGNGATSIVGGSTLSLSSTTSSAITVDSGTTGTVNLGTSANAKTVNIGTGAAVANTINIGGTGANTIAIGNTQTGGSIALGDAMTTGTITIGGTGLQTGTIGIGTGTGAQSINLGTGGTGVKTIAIGGSAANVITVGNTQTGGSIALGDAMTTGTITIGGSGLQTGTLTFGGGTGAQTVNLGTGSTGIKTVNLGTGTAANVISIGTGQTAGSIALGTAMTTGTISIGGTGAQTGTIDLGVGTGAQSINLGTGGTGVKTIAIGGTAANVISIGNTQTGGSLSVGTALTTGTITVGGTSQTGTTLIGQSTDTNTISIGNANTATGKTQTINIGAGTPAGTGLTNINIGNALNTGTLTLKAGTGNIVVGTSDTTGTLLVLDTKTGSGDPTGVNGGMYYNSNASKFRCYQASAWADCLAAGSSPFTDSGTFTYQTTTTDQLVIGASSSQSAKLAVVGTANEIQVLIKAYSSQTVANPLIKITDSTGTEFGRLTANANGNWLFGGLAGSAISSGTDNVGLGGTLISTSTGSYNVGVGNATLSLVTTGQANTVVGHGAANSTNGSDNVVMGTQAMYLSTTGGQNTIIGKGAAYSSTGDGNVALGYNALFAVGTGDYNVALGYAAGDNLTSGSNNIIIGQNIDFASATGSNQLNIAGLLTSTNYTSAGLTVNGTVAYTNGTANTNTAVCKNSSNQLAACTSSQRYKTDVTALGMGLDELRLLNPVTYTWTTNGQADMGFIAEQVASVIPQAVTYDGNGQVASFNPNTITALLTSSVKQLDLKVTAIETRLAKVEQGNFDGSVNIAGGLKVTGQTEVANIKVNGKIIGNADTRGAVVLGANTTSANYTFTSAYGTAPNIVLTPKSNPNSQYWVGNITTTGFTVYMENPSGTPTEFNFQAQQ